MSYPKDLDEYTDREIEAEYNRRLANLAMGWCTYCSQPVATHKCKMSTSGGMAKGTYDQPFSGPKFNYKDK